MATVGVKGLHESLGRHPTAVCVWRPLAKKSTTNQRKEHVGCNFVAIVIRLAVVASYICKTPRNSMKIQTYSSSRSSEVNHLGVNW